MSLSKEDILKFKELPTGNVCDANNKSGNMHHSIKPVYPTAKLAGTAFTVRCQPGDNLVLHQAIYNAKPGDVLVIDAHGYTEAGPFGEIMAIACQVRGIAGVVLDGTCRDAEDLEAMDFPFFCKGLNPGGTVKESWGVMGGAVSCGGVTVKTGDIVVGDRDGVVVVPQENAQEVLAKAQAIFKKELEVRELLKAGKTTLEIYGFDKLIASKGYK